MREIGGIGGGDERMRGQDQETTMIGDNTNNEPEQGSYSEYEFGWGARRRGGVDGG